MNVIRLFILLLLMSGLTLIAPAQRRTPSHARIQPRLSKDKPSVYLTFVRASKTAPQEADNAKERVWLRLHNNTRWAIWLDARGTGEPAFGEFDLFYAVENAEGVRLFGDTNCHVCSRAIISSGASLLFSIQRDNLLKSQRIRVAFNFDWENVSDVSSGREVVHSVFFYGTQLELN